MFPILVFSTPLDFAEWLSSNHQHSKGLWIHFYKKHTNISTITYPEALDEVLCYGWIDGKIRPYDDKSYLRMFTPRRTKSLWSRKNTQHAERLIKANRMQPAGFEQIEQAKLDGRWGRAYDSPKNIQIPNEFLQRLQQNQKAHTFYLTLNKANHYAIAWRIQTAIRPATKEKRMTAIITMLENHKQFH